MEKEVYQVAIFAWKMLILKKTQNNKPTEKPKNKTKHQKEKALEETDSSPSQINGKKGGSKLCWIPHII